MSGRWSFFPFDWEQFRQIRPRLKTACNTRDFTGIDWPEALDLFEHAEESMRAEEIGNALVAALCGGGEPLFIEGGLPATILKLRKLPGGEEPGDMLAELISANSGIEDWFRSPDGLVGLLSVPATEELFRHLERFRQEEDDRPARGLSSIARKLAVSEPARDPLQSLIRLAEESADRGFGIAAYRE